MLIFSIISAAIAPGIALLAYFYLKDRFQTEPISMVIRMFIAGAILVFPTMMVQRALVLAIGEHPLFYSFGISAALEEFMKWSILYFLIFKHVVFDEPYDGIVYAVAVSLGYATVENILYAFLNDSSMHSLLMRALLPVSGHALFGVIMGYQLGRAKFSVKNVKFIFILSLLLPVLYHGFFNYLLLLLEANWLWLMIPVMIILWVISLWTVQQANAKSPFRIMNLDDKIRI